MPYTSSLSDQEWRVIEPLLPKKKGQDRPEAELLPEPSSGTNFVRRSKRDILNRILYQLKNGCNWCDLPKDLPPYSSVFWHYKQWRSERVIEEIMVKLHYQVREQAKKKGSGQL